jgi:hypothetical protein
MIILVEHMSISRKLFRLFKFFNEYATIQKTLKGDAAPADKYLAVLTRLAFFFYWVFDNLGVLIKVKFIKSLEMAPTLRRANSFWLLGLVLTIIGGIRSLLKLAVEGKELKLKSKEMDEATYKEAANKIKASRKTAVLTLIKAFGDTTTASQGLGYPKQFLGVEFNDGIVGCGGFTSAAINCYQQYPK